MIERASATLRWTALCLLVQAGCVSGRNADEHGAVDFISPGVQNRADYAPTVGAGQPAPPLGAAGVSAPPVTPDGRAAAPPNMSAEPQSPAPAAGSGTAGRAAAVGGASGNSARNAGAGGSAAGQPAAAGAPVAGAPAPTGGGMLVVEFTSINLGGRYSPRNVGAVWIETASGMFVKTLERWAGIRANHLEHWTMVSGGWGSRFGGGGNTVDQMDAVSRATLRSHEPHRLTWDMLDATGKLVPDGKYKLGIEANDDNRMPGTWSTVEFDKGTAPQMIMAPNKAPYSGLTMRYQP